MRLLAGILTSVFMMNPIAALAVMPVAHADPEPASRFVRTMSGVLRCMVELGSVGCQTGAPNGFKNTSFEDGIHINYVSVVGWGHQLTWNESNMQSTGDASPSKDLVLTYGQVFHLNGWTVEPDSTGTRFTMDDNGLGMFITADTVTAF